MANVKKAQSRGVEEVSQVILPTARSIAVAVQRLRNDPKMFKKIVEQAQDALDVIIKGSKLIAEGAQDLVVAAYLLKEATVALFDNDSRALNEPIAENYIVDLDTAIMFVTQQSQSLQH